MPTILGSCLYYKSYNINKKLFPIIILLFLMFHSFFISETFANLTSISKVLLRMCYVLITSYLILLIFNFAKNLKLKNTPLLDFLVKASFTIYIIHQPLVYINAALITNYINNIFSQFLFINLITYLECFILFILISNSKLGRKFFGIKFSEIQLLKYKKSF